MTGSVYFIAKFVRMLLRYSFCLLFFGYLNSSGQVPAVGSSKTMDIGSWNLMWFGHEQNGPADLLKQQEGVGEVLRSARMDVWAFEEVTDTALFTQLLSKNGSFGHVYSRYWQDQKMALAWDATKWSLLADTQLFAGYGADFASGRLPLMVSLFHALSKDTFHVVAVHLKAHTGTDIQKAQAWQNRKNSSGHLYDFQKQYAGKKLIILGDWNDDIDESLVADSVSPFLAMKTAGTFLLEKQSLAGKHSWLFGNAMIDHLWANPAAMEHYKSGSADLYLLDLYIANYANDVSDHYPVYASFHFKNTTSVPGTWTQNLTMYPNPSKGSVRIEGLPEKFEWKCSDMQGKEIHPAFDVSAGSIAISGLESGIYVFTVCTPAEQQVLRLVVRE